MRIPGLGTKMRKGAPFGRMSDASEGAGKQATQLRRRRRATWRVAYGRVLEHGLDDLVEPVVGDVELAQGGHPRPRGQPCELAGSTPWSAAGSRSATNAAECGSITAFVSACGVPSTRTVVWQTAWWTAKPLQPTA